MVKIQDKMLESVDKSTGETLRAKPSSVAANKLEMKMELSLGDSV